MVGFGWTQLACGANPGGAVPGGGDTDPGGGGADPGGGDGADPGGGDGADHAAAARTRWQRWGTQTAQNLVV